MKVIGHDISTNTVFLHGTENEWDLLRILSGVPYDKKSNEFGAAYDVKKAEEAVFVYLDLQQMRKDMAALQNRWNKLMAAMDDVLGAQGKEDA